MNPELRQDIVSGDWIVIAPKRHKRPKQFIGGKKRIKVGKKGCPFENPQKTGHGEPMLLYKKNKEDWSVQVVENKFPAFVHRNICAQKIKNGPYLVSEAVGSHDLAITRNHFKNFAHLDETDANLLFRAFKDRYLMIAKDNCSAYVSIFNNWGPKAGASIFHPHYQMISIPVVPPDVKHSIDGSLNYFNKNKKCVHCVMVEWEKKNKTRVVYENDGAIVFTPFVSREPFELRIFPKKHLPYFEDTDSMEMKFVVDALQNALLKIEKELKDPDYNFFIHTAPIKDKNKHKHYHWHVEILPKISISAGFELGTGIEITVVDPDEAAKILRK